MDYILEVNNLTKHYDHFTLDHISFNLPKGTIMGLIGSNGAGKSTTINAILDLIQIDEGNILFMGEPLNNTTKEAIGVVFDEINFYDGLTPKQINRISKLAYQAWDETYYHQLLSKFNLPINKMIKEYSKGMKMKLSIAIALAHHPKLLILDEATSGLDPVVRDDILDIFWDFVQDDDHAILISSHISSDLEKICDYITCIDQGKLLFSGTKDHFLYDYGLIHCSKEQFAQIDLTNVLCYRKEDYQYSVLVEDKKAAKQLYKDMVIDDIHLDDLLLMYVKGTRVQ